MRETTRNKNGSVSVILPAEDMFWFNLYCKSKQKNNSDALREIIGAEMARFRATIYQNPFMNEQMEKAIEQMVLEGIE